MEPPPELSVIIPLHNKGPYVVATVCSVLAQSFRNWEMIVVENGSTDDGFEKVARLAEKDIRIRLLRAPDHVRGPGAARNYGLNYASGRWIQFLDADDLVLSGHFQSQIQAVRGYPDATIITCNWLEGPDYDLSGAESKEPSGANSPEWLPFSAIAFTPWVVHAAWVRASQLGSVSPWDVSFDRLTAEDHVFWFRLLLNARTAHSPHTGVYYLTETKGRRHNEKEFASYVSNVDHAVRANVATLKEKRIPMGYQFKSALLRLYLQLYACCPRRTFSAAESLVLAGIREFQPGILQSLFHHDFGALICAVVGPSGFQCLKGWAQRTRPLNP